MQSDLTRKIEPERIIAILKEMRELLLKYDYLEDADQVSEFIDVAQLEPDKLEWNLRYRGVWGASGSLSDVLFNGNVEVCLASSSITMM